MLGHLSSLQTLPFFVVGEGENKDHKIEVLGSLRFLRGKLKIYNLQNVKDRGEAKRANIQGKVNIQELVFHWDENCDVNNYEDVLEGLEPHRNEYCDVNNHEDVLEGLEPHRNVKGLILQNFGGQSFASWMMMMRNRLENLVKIELSYCRRCEQIPALGQLPYLKVVEMVGLHSLKRIGPEFYGHHSGAAAGGGGGAVFPALEVLTLHDLESLEEWSDAVSITSSADAGAGTVVFFPLLKRLSIVRCPRLNSIPGHLYSFQELFIGPGKSGFSRIDYRSSPGFVLEVFGHSEIDIFLEVLLEKSSKSLTRLVIIAMVGLYYLPNNLKNLASLEILTIDGCSDLISITKETKEAFSGLTSLQTLLIENCPQLTCLPKWLLRHTLVQLELSGCHNLIIEDQNEFRCLTSLRRLTIVWCPRLVSCWDERLPCSLTSLQQLEIGDFSQELEYFPWLCSASAAASATTEIDDDMDHPQQYPFPSLESLTLRGWPELENLPDQLQHLTALRELSIYNFPGLKALPEWLGNLSSLQALNLYFFSSLVSLPSLEAMQRLTNLRSLHIYGSPHLAEICKSRSGQDWHKLTHIPSIKLN